VALLLPSPLMMPRLPITPPLVVALMVMGLAGWGRAEADTSSSMDFVRYAMKLRESAIQKIEPEVVVSGGNPLGFNRYPWRKGIVTTVFWVGERPTANNPVPNYKSSWDPNWAANFGGMDNPDPERRRNFIPMNFKPRQNPFYVALPYNDVTHGFTKPEARKVIPWFRQAFERPGKSVLKGRWIAVRHGNRIAYAQWEDCGPFRTDHYQYVFGDPKTGAWERPKPNLNQGAGLDVSPAVRDYLGLVGKDACDWKFVEFKDVPAGPWSKYGDNNTFVLRDRRENLFLVDRNNAYSAKTRQ